MELHHLRTFVVVAEEQNVTRAAKRLYMTPPTVSSHIKALEDELNVQLFQRTSRGMVLTEKGQLLRDKAAQTLWAAQDLVNHATTLQGELMGPVRIGLNSSAEFLHIPALVQQLAQEAPGIDVRLTASTTGKILEALQANALDAGYVFGPVSAEFHAVALGDVEVVVAAPAAWAAECEQADWATLASRPWICSDYYCPFQTLLDETMEARGLMYTRVVESDHDQTKAQLVAAGVGLALLTRAEANELAEGNSAEVVGPPALTTPLSFVTLADRAEEPLLRVVAATVANNQSPITNIQ